MNSQTPLISIIIPTYNRSELILDSTKSVLNQTYDNIELIVVDDGSTDDTLSKLNAIDDSRLIIQKTKGREGANAARNLGASCAKGEYLAFQDSDDKWLVDKLEKQIQFIQEHYGDAVFCSFIRLTSRSTSLLPFEFLRKSMIENSYKAEIKHCLRFNVISTQTLLIKKDIFNELAGFDNNLPRLQDWDFAIRLLQKYNVFFLDIPLVNVYEQNDSISLKPDALIEAQQALLKKHNAIYREYYFDYLRIIYRLFKLKIARLLII